MTKEELKEKIESLACVNYNMYFGSPAERADKYDKDGEKVRITFDEAIEELQNFILSKFDLYKKELVEKVKTQKVHNPGKPDEDGSYAHYDFGYRAGYNQALDQVISIINEKL